jgi:glutathione peroxidase
MKYVLTLLVPLCILFLAPAAVAADVASSGPSAMALKSLDGSPMSSETLEGKTVLFVNVASRCGYTSQYEGLQALYEEKKKEGLVIVGVPCNQFGSQEPGSAKEIATFCERNYGVTFPILEKQDVNGSGRSALYDYLVDSKVGGGSDVGWNFEKFLVNKTGDVVGRFPSGVTPGSSKLAAAISDALK